MPSGNKNWNNIWHNTNNNNNDNNNDDEKKSRLYLYPLEDDICNFSHFEDHFGEKAVYDRNILLNSGDMFRYYLSSFLLI